MSDLIERLRSLADCDARAGAPLGRAMHEAADRIAKLEGLLAETRGLVASLYVERDAALAEVARLRAEVERARFGYVALAAPDTGGADGE